MRKIVFILLTFAFALMIMNGCVAVRKYELKDGYELLNSGEMDSARQVFENILSSSEDPRILSQAYEGLGWVEVVSGEYQTAILKFNQALDLDPNMEDAIYGLIICEWSLKNWNDLAKQGEAFSKKTSKSYTFTKLQKYRSDWNEIMELLLASYVILGEDQKSKELMDELPSTQFTESIRRAMNCEF